MALIKKNLTINLLTLLVLIVPNFLDAQSVSLSTGKTTYTTNDNILVSVYVETGGQQINTIGGQVSFQPSLNSVSDVRYGNSIISLWVDKPTANNSLGTIIFIGGVPGGFSGSRGNLFTFVVKPKSEGTLNISLKDVHVLLNDGSGGELQGLKTPPLVLNITKANESIPVIKDTTPNVVEKVVNIAPKDSIAPENFIPMVSHHESIANDSQFVSFSAVDKDSGVAHYKVREVPKIIGFITDRFSTSWVDAVSPHVLYYQSWGTRVEVMAVDGAGNSTVGSADKSFGTLPLVMLIVCLMILSVILTRIFTKKVFHIRRK